jgi:hypothetical protein
MGTRGGAWSRHRDWVMSVCLLMCVVRGSPCVWQVALVYITVWMNKRLKNERAGNMFFWFVFCIFGQPLAVTLYYHDYMVQHSRI